MINETTSFCIFNPFDGRLFLNLFLETWNSLNLLPKTHVEAIEESCRDKYYI